MATEEQLRDLNKDVYNVFPNYQGNPTLKEGDILETGDGQQFIVLSTKNGDYGFQGMAVAPINKGLPDYDQVTVLAAGTDSSNPTDLGTAIVGAVATSPQEV